MDGIIILDKDSGLFSRTAGWRVAKMFNEKKFGHIGTLDPMASGVLPVVIGNATKMIPFIEEICPNTKEYLFGLQFGTETDSLDITGNTTKTSDVLPTEDEIKQTCKKFIGTTEQIPPAFSAIHIDGKRAYDLARHGEKVDIKPRKIIINELEYLGKSDKEYNFRVSCSRGTYVRSIVRDIANICGTVATTTYIRRTQTNGFSIKHAVKLDFLEKMFNNHGDIKEYLMAPDCTLGDIPVINLVDEDVKLYKNGGFIKTDESNGLRRVYSGKTFIGIGHIYNGLLHPKRTL